MFGCIRKIIILSYALIGEIPISLGVAMDPPEKKIVEKKAAFKEILTEESIPLREIQEGQISKMLPSRNDDSRSRNIISNHLLRINISDHLNEYEDLIALLGLEEVSKFLKETAELMICIDTAIDVDQKRSSSGEDIKASSWNINEQLRTKILSHLQKYKSGITTPSNLDKVIDFIKKTAETVGTVGLTIGLSRDEIISPWITIIYPSDCDIRLRDGILSHMSQHGDLFTPLGLKKGAGMLEALKYFCDNAILFRPETDFALNGHKIDIEQFKEPIFSLLEDYKTLMIIVASDKSIYEINDALREVKINFYHTGYFALDSLKLNRCQKQFETFNVITGEAGAYLSAQKAQLSKVQNSPSGASKSMLELQKKFISFLTKYKYLMKKIEMERRGFDLMLKSLCETDRDDKLNNILREFSDLTKTYEQKIQTKIGIEQYSERVKAIKMAEAAREEAEAAEKREAYDKRELEKAEMNRLQKSPRKLDKYPKSTGVSSRKSDPSPKRSRDSSRSTSKSPKKSIDPLNKSSGDSLKPPSDQQKSSGESPRSRSPNSRSIDSLKPPVDNHKPSAGSPRANQTKKSFFGFGS